MANYFGGSVAVLPILPDGRLGEATDVKIDDGDDRPHPGHQRSAGQLRLQRARPDSRPHDPGRSLRTLRPARRPGPGPHLRLEIRRAAGPADAQRPALRARCRQETARATSTSIPNGRWLYSIQEEGSTIVLFDYDARTGRLTARQTISTLPPGFAGSNFCSENPGVGRRPVRLRRQPAARQHRDLPVGPDGDADLRRRGMDARRLPAQLQLRPHRPVPLLLQSARRQHRRLPRRSRDRPARPSPATTRRSAILRSSSSSISRRRIEEIAPLRSPRYLLRLSAPIGPLRWVATEQSISGPFSTKPRVEVTSVTGRWRPP